MDEAVQIRCYKPESAITKIRIFLTIIFFICTFFFLPLSHRGKDVDVREGVMRAVGAGGFLTAAFILSWFNTFAGVIKVEPQTLYLYQRKRTKLLKNLVIPKSDIQEIKGYHKIHPKRSFLQYGLFHVEIHSGDRKLVHGTLKDPHQAKTLFDHLSRYGFLEPKAQINFLNEIKRMSLDRYPSMAWILVVLLGLGLFTVIVLLVVIQLKLL